MFIGLIIDNLNNIVNNPDRLVFFFEYPNRYPNWVAHFGTQYFQLTLSYLLVVSSPFTTHSGLECILLCHRSYGIFPAIFQRQRYLAASNEDQHWPHLPILTLVCPEVLVHLHRSSWFSLSMMYHLVDANVQTTSIYSIWEHPQYVEQRFFFGGLQ